MYNMLNKTYLDKLIYLQFCLYLVFPIQDFTRSDIFYNHTSRSESLQNADPLLRIVAKYVERRWFPG